MTAAWLAALAIHAALLARRHLPPSSKRSVVAGLAAVAVVVAGYVAYGIAGGAVFDAGLDAQRAGDCATATDRFATVTGPFELTLSRNVAEAEARTRECADYSAAVDAQKKGDHAAAIKRYTEFRDNYPLSVLRRFAHNNLAESHVADASDWQLPLATADAIQATDTLLMVIRDFGDTPAAERAPKAIADLFEAANAPFRAGDFCGALPTLNHFAGLAPDVLPELDATAHANRARALYECGLAQVRAGDHTAVATLETFVAAYPQDAGIPQAASALVTAKVAQAAQVTLPVPPPLGDNSPGDIPVTFYNDSTTALTILVAGPTAHEISLPPCPGCPADYAAGETPCPTFDGRPAVTLNLTATTYYLTTERDDLSERYTGSVTPLVGYEHTQCMYVERR